MGDGRKDYSQFTCQVCGAKSKMHEDDDPEIEDGLPPGWELLHDFAVCPEHFDLIAPVVGRALREVVELLRPSSESKTCVLQPRAFIHATFLVALEREEVKLHDFAEERRRAEEVELRD